MQGVEKNWVKQDPTKSVGVLQISPKEWQAAKAVARLRTSRGEKPPFKLSKEELRTAYPKHAAYLNHDLLVLPTQDGSYKVGVMARSEIYTNASGEEVKEGILGRGAFGVAKIIQWEDGTVDAVKIEDAGKEEEHRAERQIMQDLGYLRAAFVERRSVAEPWIGGKQIKDVLYTVQQRHVGIEMKDYFTNFDVTRMGPIKRYEMGLQAALSIDRLHALNILHCDIKPGNFMINWQGDTAVVTAIDFGISMRLPEGQATIQSSPRGTPKYVAPEVAEYQRDPDGQLYIHQDAAGKASFKLLSTLGMYSKAADVFSLGIMFRDDLELGEPGSPFQDMVRRMTAHNPQERPSMDEVIATMFKSDIKFRQLYQNLEVYTTKKTLQKGHSWFHRSRIDAADQIAMVKALEDTLKQYKRAPLHDDERVDQTVDNILSIMKENQSRHEDVTLSTASTFNIKTLQSLPDELRSGICKKLGIDESSDILKKTDYSTRKELAAIVSKYKLIGSKPAVTETEHNRPRSSS